MKVAFWRRSGRECSERHLDSRTLTDYRGAEFGAEGLLEAANRLIEQYMPRPSDSSLEEPHPLSVQMRTLRFYSSIGILPPHEGPRRRARYGYRHLVSLVAARLLNYSGYKLEAIRQILLANSNHIDELAQRVQSILEAQRERREVAANLLQFSFEFREVSYGREFAPTPQEVVRLPITPDVTLEVDKSKIHGRESEVLASAISVLTERLPELTRSLKARHSEGILNL